MKKSTTQPPFEIARSFQALENSKGQISRHWKFAVIAAQLIAASSLPLLTTGCQRGEAAETADAPAAKIEGEKISFPDKSPQAGQIKSEPAERGKPSTDSVTARLAWDDDVTAKIFSPVIGRVTKIPVEIGSVVAADDVLAELQSADYGQAQADVKKAASDLALADRSLTRLRELFAHGAAAQKDVDSAEADYEKAVSEGQRANSQVRSLSRGNTNEVDSVFLLRSPLAGIVVEKTISPGQLARPDQMLANAPAIIMPLLVVSDPTKLWLWLDVTEMNMSKFKPGMPLKIHTRAFPGRVFEGSVTVIGSSLDPDTRTVKVRGLVDNSSNLLKAEMFVTVDAPAEETAASVDISNRAVFLKKNRHFVFVESAPGQFERREVTVGAEHNGRTVIVSGVDLGQKVVTDGAIFLDSLLESGGA